MDAPYVSDELFHFVGRDDPTADAHNWSILSKILRSKCVSHPPHRSDWGDTRYTLNFNKRLADGDFIVPCITCYCDVPFGSLGVHCAKYGRFGLALHRDVLIKYGARPVTYVPMHPNQRVSPFGATLLDDIQQVFRYLHNHVSFDPVLANTPRERTICASPTTPAEAICATDSIFSKDIVAFIKPFDASLSPDDPNNYYMEREWRKFGNMCFNATDVSRVIVAAGFGERARQQFPEYKDIVFEV